MHTTRRRAIEIGADYVDVGKTIHPHRTLGESIGMAGEIAHGSCTDARPVRRLHRHRPNTVEFTARTIND
jgi:hypothetical protein